MWNWLEQRNTKYNNNYVDRSTKNLNICTLQYVYMYLR